MDLYKVSQIVTPANAGVQTTVLAKAGDPALNLVSGFRRNDEMNCDDFFKTLKPR